MKIASSLIDLVGNTPLLSMKRLSAAEGLKYPLTAKLEFFNPLSSAKDRIAVMLIKDAYDSGLINSDTVIIEATSGNTGIGLAFVSRIYANRLILTMPSTMSSERIKLLEFLGAEVVLTDAADGMTGAVKKAEELKESIGNAYIPDQFSNPSNPYSHELTTGPEIWRDTDGNIDCFIACIGTGGTISGVGKYLIERNDSISIVGVEPAASPLLSCGCSAPHKIQGIGANFVPHTLDMNVVDEIVTITDEEAFEYSKKAALCEGLCVGISSGAAICAAVKTAKKYQYENIVVLLVDSAERYMSTELFDCK